MPQAAIMPIMMGVGAGTSLIGSGLSSRASGRAAEAGVDATRYAADLNRQSELESLGLQREAFNATRGDLAPYQAVGRGALGELSSLMGLGTLQQTANPNQGGRGNTILPGQPGGQPSGVRGNIAPKGQAGDPHYLTGALPNDGLPFRDERTDQAGMLAPGGLYGPDSGWLTGSDVPPGVRDAAITAEQGEMNRLNNISGVGVPGVDPSVTSPVQQYELDPSTAVATGTPGELALPMSEVMQDWQTDPGYEFRTGQGEDSINRYLATTGMPFGGTAAKALIDYNQGFASNEYGNVWNRTSADRTDRYNKLANLAGMGQTASTQVGNAGLTSAANQGNIMMNSANIRGDLATQSANARASGIVGSANAWGGAMSSLGQLPFQYMMMNDLFGGGGGGGGGGFGYNSFSNFERG